MGLGLKTFLNPTAKAVGYFHNKKNPELAREYANWRSPRFRLRSDPDLFLFHGFQMFLRSGGALKPVFPRCLGPRSCLRLYRCERCFLS